MADIRPTGTATTMAMAEIISVPAKTGTAPKAPEEPTWSSRMAIWGLHFKPNKNSVMEIFSKNRMASNRTDSRMPMVVKIAIVEQAIRIHLMMLST